MTFPANIEQWRSVVRDAIANISTVEPDTLSVLATLNVSGAELEDIILAIINRESSPPGNANSIGDAGNSFGLMQVNYGVWSRQANNPDLQYCKEGRLVRVYSGRELLTPAIGIGVGTRYFLKQLRWLKNVNAAILAYNTPARGLEYLQGVIPFNIEYLRFVLSKLGVSETFFTEKKTLIGAGAVLLVGSIALAIYLKGKNRNG